MGNLNVVVIGPIDYAKDIGKKSTTSDITFYDQKRGETTLNLIEPTQYPDKLASLFYATSLATIALVVVEKIDAVFGECAVMLDCAGIKKGYFVLRNYITPEQLNPLIKGTVLQNYEFIDDDAIKIRERLLKEADKVDSKEPPSNISTGVVPIDHFFDVKGIGTVVLGTIVEGVIRRHDEVRVLPSAKIAEVRSIQKHDDDFSWSTKGDHIGFVLKGVEITDIDRGTVLTNDSKIKTSSSFNGKMEIVKYWLIPLKENMVLHIGHWMQFLPCRVESIEDSGDWRNPTIKLKLEKELVFLPGSTAIITHVDAKKLRVIGTMKLD